MRAKFFLFWYMLGRSFADSVNEEGKYIFWIPPDYILSFQKGDAAHFNPITLDPIAWWNEYVQTYIKN